MGNPLQQLRIILRHSLLVSVLFWFRDNYCRSSTPCIDKLGTVLLRFPLVYCIYWYWIFWQRAEQLVFGLSFYCICQRCGCDYCNWCRHILTVRGTSIDCFYFVFYGGSEKYILFQGSCSVRKMAFFTKGFDFKRVWLQFNFMQLLIMQKKSSILWSEYILKHCTQNIFSGFHSFYWWFF